MDSLVGNSQFFLFMKIAVLSDIHNFKSPSKPITKSIAKDINSDYYDFSFLELSEKDRKNLSDVDVFVVAGDISEKWSYNKWVDKFVEEIKTFNKKKFDFLSIPGNHDYYESGINRLYYFSKDLPNPIKSTYIHKTYSNVSIIGTTLWSPPDRPECYRLTDYYYIPYFSNDDNGNCKNVLKVYKRERDWLIKTVKKEKELYPDNKIIVFTHHAPLSCLIPDKYKNTDTSYLNGCFANMNKKDNEKYLSLPVDIWVYGHTHENKDEVINNIRFISNQRGYRHEKEIYDNFKPQIITV